MGILLITLRNRSVKMKNGEKRVHQKVVQGELTFTGEFSQALRRLQQIEDAVDKVRVLFLQAANDLQASNASAKKVEPAILDVGNCTSSQKDEKLSCL